MKSQVVFVFSFLSFLTFALPLFAQEEINLKALNNYLFLSEKDTYSVLHSLIGILTEEWLSLDWSTSSPEKLAVPLILRKAVRVDALNYLLLDAPVTVLWHFFKETINLYRLISGDSQNFFGELERQSVKKSLQEIGSYFSQKQIKIANGAIQFEYKNKEGKRQEPVVQYIVIYKEVDDTEGKILLRIYSPNFLSSPESTGSIGGKIGIPNDLETNLPPFIVTISGEIKKTSLGAFAWKNQPQIEIAATVPDFGLRPLSFWERRFLRPIENQIRQVKVVIAKVIEKPSEAFKHLPEIGSFFFNFWQKVRAIFSNFQEFFSAGLFFESQEAAKEIEEKLDFLKENLVRLENKNQSFPKTLLKQPQEGVNSQTRKILNQNINQSFENKKETADETEKGSQKINQENQLLEKKTLEKPEPVDQNLLSEQKQDKQDNLKKEDEKKNSSQILCQETPNSLPLANKVIFNEIAWMGTLTDANNEWLELKNISSEEINLEGWQLKDKNNDINIIFGKIILKPGAFLLLERTDDNSVPEISADLIYKGSLANNNEELYLFDNNCVLQDKVLANPSWLGGENDSKKTMERTAFLTWQTSLQEGGTPKKENSFFLLSSTTNNPSLSQGNQSNQNNPISASSPSFCSLSSAPPLQSPVIINEIAWMGTQAEANNEWLELRNLTSNPVSLEGWQLLDKDYQIKIIFNSDNQIPANGYFLLERTDENSVPNIPADKIYTGSLSDTNETLWLFDKNCNLIDEVKAEPNWPAGDKNQRRTMERKDDLSWQTYQCSVVNGILGTPKAVNSQCDNNDNSNSSNGNSSNNNQSNNSPETPTLEVVINEIGWMGTPADTSDEWIELYNNTDQTIDLTDWTLKAADGSPEIKLTGSIPGKGFFLLERTNDNTISDLLADQIFQGALDNDGEKLELRNNQGVLIDLVDASEGWFAGSSSPDFISMERVKSNLSGNNPQNWQNNNTLQTNHFDKAGNYLIATPKAPNSANQGPVILPSFLRHNALLKKELSPFLIFGTVTVAPGKTLTIEPGVVLKFSPNLNPGQESYLILEGNLRALGTTDEPIIFTSLRDDSVGGNNRRPVEDFLNGEPIAPQPGDWIQISVRENSTIEIRNAIIRYGGYDGFSNAALVVNRGKAIIENVIFEKNGESLWLLEAQAQVLKAKFLNNEGGIVTLRIRGKNPKVENSLFENNKQTYLISIDSQSEAEIIDNRFQNNPLTQALILVERGSNPVFLGNQGANNHGFNAILMSQSGTAFKENAVLHWQENALPYLISGSFLLPQSNQLIIEPGVVVKLGDFLRIEGSLKAEGLAEKPIIFTSLHDDDFGGDTNGNNNQTLPQIGDWNNIQLAETSSVILKNVQIRYAGKEGVTPLLIENGARVIQENINFFP